MLYGVKTAQHGLQVRLCLGYVLAHMKEVAAHFENV